MTDSLLKKAETFIKTAPYFDLICSQGILHFTGSYFLNTMTWPDMDMQLSLEEGVDALKVMSMLSNHLINLEEVKKVEFQNLKKYPKPHMPSGLYLGAFYFDQNLDDFWKLDLWILNQSDFEKNRVLMETLKNQMTPSQRDKIVKIKSEWTLLYGRTPKMASYYLYQAVILNHMEKREEIDAYLQKNGVIL